MTTKKTNITVISDINHPKLHRHAQSHAGHRSASAAKPVIDIAPAGTFKPADPTTRPVIVRQRPLMQDPMVMAVPMPASSHGTNNSGDAAVTAIDKDADASDKDADGIVDKPTSTSMATAYGPVFTPAVTPPAKPERSAAPVMAPSPLARPADEDIEAELSPSDSFAAPGERQLAADAKSAEEFDELIDDKTYFLPIETVEKRRSRRVFIFGTLLIIVLALLWLDISLDAGFIKVGNLQPLTHFFQTTLKL